MYLFELLHLNMSNFSIALCPSLMLCSFPGHNCETIVLVWWTLNKCCTMIPMSCKCVFQSYCSSVYFLYYFDLVYCVWSCVLFKYLIDYHQIWYNPVTLGVPSGLLSFSEYFANLWLVTGGIDDVLRISTLFMYSTSILLLICTHGKGVFWWYFFLFYIESLCQQHTETVHSVDRAATWLVTCEHFRWNRDWK